MNRRLLLTGLLGLLLLSMLPLELVSAAHTAQNLTLTAGTGSAWVTGGYSFAKTAKATKTGFKPFAAKGAITLDLWMKCEYHTGVQYVVSVYVSSTDNVKIIFSGANIYYDVGANGVVSNARWENILSNGSVYHIIGTWDKSSNGGKADLFVNGSKHTATTGTGAFDTGANDDLWISGADGSSSLLKGTVYSLGIYYEKWGYAEANKTHVSRDAMLSTVDYYWTFNTGSGTTFYDWDDAWYYTEAFSLDAVTGDLQWWTVENQTIDLRTMVQTWHKVVSEWIDMLAHSIFPSLEHDSWFYVLILAFVGALACFGMVAYMISEGDYDLTTISILGMVGVFALLICLGVILV